MSFSFMDALAFAFVALNGWKRGRIAQAAGESKSCDRGAPQSAETIAVVRENRLAMRPGDRLAPVVPAGLCRLQASRSYLSDVDRAFASEAEAIDWLAQEDLRATG
jgi:hypothetical protein